MFSRNREFFPALQGFAPAPPRTFLEKSSTKNSKKSRIRAIFCFCPAFKGRSERSERFPRHPSKSGWGAGTGRPPAGGLLAHASRAKSRDIAGVRSVFTA